MRHIAGFLQAEMLRLQRFVEQNEKAKKIKTLQV